MKSLVTLTCADCVCSEEGGCWSSAAESRSPQEARVPWVYERSYWCDAVWCWITRCVLKLSSFECHRKSLHVLRVSCCAADRPTLKEGTRCSRSVCLFVCLYVCPCLPLQCTCNLTTDWTELRKVTESSDLVQRFHVTTSVAILRSRGHRSRSSTRPHEVRVQKNKNCDKNK